MIPIKVVAATILGAALLPLASASAQFSGSRGGIGSENKPISSADELLPLSPEVAQGYITIEGKAELRVKPTEIRVVLAVTAEGKTPAECQQVVSETVRSLTTAWTGIGIPQEKIVEDFIAVLPRYEFEVQNIRGREVAVETKVGYLMQSNLHVAFKNDAQAMEAINLAFKAGVADIIAFDYWSRELDQLKVNARADALRAARAKSDVLLGALFDKLPQIINVQEATRVYYPESLYESFGNSIDNEYHASYSRNDLPQLRMFRPKNTYYRGLYLDGDVQSKELPMQSEISIVSTVRLYFESPVAKERQAVKKEVQ